MVKGKKTQIYLILFLILLLVHIIPIAIYAGDITLLHEFAGGVDDGMSPYGSLIQSGSTLYGMTWHGGDHGDGVIFSIGTDGNGFTLLHEFGGGIDNGREPKGSLIQSGSTLYGMTDSGGDNDKGVIFSIGTDGSGFTLLHVFAGGVNDGAYPDDSLIYDGSTLYGMTERGGDSDIGVIFSIGTDGSEFTLLHEFAGGDADGSQPLGALTQSGSTLYGMTWRGGDSDLGVIFSIGIDGNGFTLLHEFTAGINDGFFPFGSLIQSGNTLYGMTLMEDLIIRELYFLSAQMVVALRSSMNLPVMMERLLRVI
ncbi:MAG: choice-of-anchor tandem repeat GloVer-containing protein [bacterium]